MRGSTGILLAGYSASATLDMGDALLMPSIAAVVIGGARVTGGYGHYLGTLSGALFLSTLSTVITALSLSQGFRDVIQGAIILIALLLQTGGLPAEHADRSRAAVIEKREARTMTVRELTQGGRVYRQPLAGACSRPPRATPKSTTRSSST